MPELLAETSKKSSLYKSLSHEISIETIELLINNGAVDAESPILSEFFERYRYIGQTPDVQIKYLQITKDLIEKAQADVNKKNVHGRSPLYIAIACSYIPVEVIELLLENGAVDAESPILSKFFGRYRYTGQTPDIQLKYLQLTKDLIEKAQADVNKKSIYDQSPLYMALACSYPPIEVIELLLKKGAVDTESPILSEFFERYRYTNQTSDVQVKYLQITKDLIEKAQADINKKSIHDQSPLYMALVCSYPPIEIIELLLEKNVVIDDIQIHILKKYIEKVDPDNDKKENICEIFIAAQKNYFGNLLDLSFLSDKLIKTIVAKTSDSKECHLPNYVYKLYILEIDDLTTDIKTQELLKQWEKQRYIENFFFFDRRVLITKYRDIYNLYYQDTSENYKLKEIKENEILLQIKKLAFKLNVIAEPSTVDHESLMQILDYFIANILEHNLKRFLYVIEFHAFRVANAAIELGKGLKIEKVQSDRIYKYFVTKMYDLDPREIPSLLGILQHCGKQYFNIEENLINRSIIKYIDVNDFIFNIQFNKIQELLNIGLKPSIILLHLAAEKGKIGLAHILNQHFGNKFRLVEKAEDTSICMIPLFNEKERSKYYLDHIEKIKTIQSLFYYRKYKKQDCLTTGNSSHIPPKIKLSIISKTSPDIVCHENESCLFNRGKHYSPNIHSILLSGSVLYSKQRLEQDIFGYTKGISNRKDSENGDDLMISFAPNKTAAEENGFGCVTVKFADSMVGLLKLRDFQDFSKIEYRDPSVSITGEWKKNTHYFLEFYVQCEDQSGQASFSQNEISYYGKVVDMRNFALNFLFEIIRKLDNKILKRKLIAIENLKWRKLFANTLCEFSEIAFPSRFSLTIDNMAYIQLSKERSKIDIESLKQIIVSKDVNEIKAFLTSEENRFLQKIDFIMMGIFILSYDNQEYGNIIRQYLQKNIGVKIFPDENIRILNDKIIKKALSYIDYNYLSTKYEDNDISNNPSGAFKHNEKWIYRPFHGVLHVVRTIAYMDDVIEYFKCFSKDEKLKTFCDKIRYPDKLLLGMALVFLVSGRQSEVDFKHNPKKCTEYRKNSAEYFLKYCQLLKLFRNKDLAIYHKCILDLCKPWDAKDSEPYKHIRVLIDCMHQLDLPRCKTEKEYLSYMEKYDSLIIPSKDQEKAKERLLSLAREVNHRTESDKDKGPLSLQIDQCISRVQQLYNDHRKLLITSESQRYTTYSLS